MSAFDRAPIGIGEMTAVLPLLSIQRRALDLTGSVRNRSVEGISGGSSITATEVCCPSNISRNFPIAFVMSSLYFAPT
jgi:hypothetical protein